MQSPVSSTDPTRTQWQPALTPPEQPPASAPGRRAKARSLFWPGFALGFLLLAIVSCGGLGIAFGFNRISLAELQGSDVAWTPPSIAPTSAVAVQAETTGGQRVATTFSAGEIVRNLTNSRVNIRATPGYQGKAAADILGQLQPGDTLQVVGDSALADNLIWWRIRYAAPDGRTLEGWVAEATASGVQILGE